MNLNKDISEVFKDIFIEEFYNFNYREEFYKLIIEKENEIQLSPSPNEKSINELCLLYKKAIDLFKGDSIKKIEFFTNKIFNLILGKTKVKKFNSLKKTKWSQIIQKNRKNINIFILSTTISFSKYRIKTLIKEFNDNIYKGINKIYDDLKKQRNKFIQRKNNMKINLKDKLNIHHKKFSNNIIKKNIFHKDEIIEIIINNFFKQIYYFYFHLNFLEKEIDVINDIFNEIYRHKIQKYFNFQEPIKQFEFLLKSDIDDEQNESFNILLEKLQNEKNKYFMKIDIFVEKIKLNLQDKNKTLILKNKFEINLIKLSILNNLFSIFLNSNT